MPGTTSAQSGPLNPSTATTGPELTQQRYMTPLEKHIEALEAELELQLTERNPTASTDAVRAAIQVLPRVIDLFNTGPRIRTEEEQAVLRLPNGMAIALRPDGTCTLRREGRQDREYPTLTRLLADPELLREMRKQKRPYFEIRPFIGLSELLDEIVASPARVSIRRNGKTEYLIRVNEHGFRMSNRGPSEQEEDQAPSLLFELIDPDHMPGDSGTVEHTADPARPSTLEGLEGYDTSLHIEQMHDWNFWAGIGSGSYSFTPQKQEGPRLQLTRLSEKETTAHFRE